MFRSGPRTLLLLRFQEKFLQLVIFSKERSGSRQSRLSLCLYGGSAAGTERERMANQRNGNKASQVESINWSQHIITFYDNVKEVVDEKSILSLLE